MSLCARSAHSDKTLLENFTAPRKKIKPMCDCGSCDFAVMAKAATSPQARSKRSDACRAAYTPPYKSKKVKFFDKECERFLHRCVLIRKSVKRAHGSSSRDPSPRASCANTCGVVAGEGWRWRGKGGGGVGVEPRGWVEVRG